MTRDVALRQVGLVPPSAEVLFGSSVSAARVSTEFPPGYTNPESQLLFKDRASMARWLTPALSTSRPSRCPGYLPPSALYPSPFNLLPLHSTTLCEYSLQAWVYPTHIGMLCWAPIPSVGLVPRQRAILWASRGHLHRGFPREVQTVEQPPLRSVLLGPRESVERGPRSDIFGPPAGGPPSARTSL